MELGNKILIIGSSILAFVILFVVAGTTIKVPYTATVTYVEKVPYEAREPYEVQEPYSVRECHDVKVPYLDEECKTREYSYSVENHDVIKEFASLEKGYMCYGSFDIRNNENKGGYWTFSYTFYGKHGPIDKPSQTKYIYPISTEHWVFSYDCDADEAVSGRYHVVSIPKLTECEKVTKYKTETRCETVTKYRTITKYRTVTKYRVEERERAETRYRTLFEEWRYRLGL